MSLYWLQQAVPTGDSSADASRGAQPGQGQQDQWANVNLGGAPTQPYQWDNYSQQSAGATTNQTYETGPSHGQPSGAYVGQANQYAPHSDVNNHQHQQQQNQYYDQYQQHQWNGNSQLQTGFQPAAQAPQYQQEPSQILHTPILNKNTEIHTHQYAHDVSHTPLHVPVLAPPQSNELYQHRQQEYEHGQQEYYSTQNNQPNYTQYYVPLQTIPESPASSYIAASSVPTVHYDYAYQELHESSIPAQPVIPSIEHTAYSTSEATLVSEPLLDDVSGANAVEACSYHSSTVPPIPDYVPTSTSVQSDSLPDSTVPILYESVVQESQDEQVVDHSLSLDAEQVSGGAEDASPPSSSKSSQVTPESSYSVDTFGSEAPNAEQTEETPRKDDEWDDWEQPNSEDTVHETSPSEAASQTQSEPPGYASSVASQPSREPSMGPSNGWEQRDSTPNGVYNTHRQVDPVRVSDPQPVVAQVAPLVKTPSAEPSGGEHHIARVEPVPAQQFFDSPSNVQRVAPTRTLVNASQASQADHETVVEQNAAAVPVTLEPLQTVPVPVVATAPVVVTPAAEIPPPPLQALNVQLEDANNILEPPSADVSRISPAQHSSTPDVQHLHSISVLSPGEAQATSTPITEREVDRSVNTRRGSSSSVRSGVPHSHTAPVLSGEHSDSTQGSLSLVRNSGVRSSYNERYRGVRERYMDTHHTREEVMQRLDRHRVETPRAKKTNPLADAQFLQAGRRSAIQVLPVSHRAGPNANSSIDSTHYRPDLMNQSTYSQPDPLLNESVDISGEDFVDESRRRRMHRRPESRARSEIGENGPYRGPHVGYGGPPHARSSAYDHSGYGMHPSFYGMHPGYNSVGRHSGRNTSVGMPYHPDYYQQQHHQQMMYMQQRPQSVDPSSHRAQRPGVNYDTFSRSVRNHTDENIDNEEEDETSSLDDDEEESEHDSEDEMNAYNASAIHPVHYPVQASVSMRSVGAGPYGSQEMYFFGVIKLEAAVVDRILHHLRVPQQFYTLKPIEKAAYLFYAAVYKKLFSAVDKFHTLFNREFFNYKSKGDSDNEALCKICDAMRVEHDAKVKAANQERYMASQKQLFSNDDRDSAEGQSDRVSDIDDVSDIMSVDTSQRVRAPLKYRGAHAFSTFGPGGKMVTVPANSDMPFSIVQIDDVKTMLRDNHSKRLIDAAQMFRGPLIAGTSPSHSVRLYIQRQLKRIRDSEVAAENPLDNDVIDTLLVWQLLEIVVQQQGRVTGPDIARLLMEAGLSVGRRAASTTPVVSSENVNDKKPTPEPRAYEDFTAFLLGGHIDEAVNCALRYGLYADAMVLVRRIFANDPQRLADIETRFLATRPATNPVMTLVAVASGEPAPILTNPPDDNTGSWRTHAAIVLANLNTGHAMDTVYRLGRVLAKREYNAAADFCLLAVALLGNYDIFQPPPQSDEDAKVRQHITLIHASLPDDEWDTTVCRYGFSLTDLHATEIFDYGIQLAQRQSPSPLQNSIEFQRKRFQYAKLLSDFGGFTTDSFRYCMAVASAIWPYYHMLTAVELNELADLADRLRFSASEGTEWIDSLRGMIQQLVQSGGGLRSQQPQYQTEQNPDPQQHEAHQQEQAHHHEVVQHQVQADVHVAPAAEPLEINPIASRSRSESLATDARNWHEDRQEPLQMSPVGSTQMRTATPPPPVHVQPTSPTMSDYQTPPDHSVPFGEQLCQVQQGQHNNYQGQYDQHTSQYDDDRSSSAPDSSSQTTTSVESTPTRQPHHQSSHHNHYEAAPDVPSVAVQYSNYQTPQYSQPQQPVHQQFAPQQHQQQLDYPTVPQPDVHSNHQQSNQHTPQQHYPQQHQMQQNQRPQDNGAVKKQPLDSLKKGDEKKGSQGFFSKLINKVVPDSKSMILPDDRNKPIRWDENLKKYVGEGVEEEVAAAPPPKMDSMPTMTGTGAMAPQQGGGLRAARGSGGSRYFNSMASSNGPAAPTVAAPMMPSMPIPTTFSFMPTTPDDVDSVDPFSGHAEPTIHGSQNNADNQST